MVNCEKIMTKKIIKGSIIRCGQKCHFICLATLNFVGRQMKLLLIYSVCQLILLASSFLFYPLFMAPQIYFYLENGVLVNVKKRFNCGCKYKHICEIEICFSEKARMLLLVSPCPCIISMVHRRSGQVKRIRTMYNTILINYLEIDQEDKKTNGP